MRRFPGLYIDSVKSPDERVLRSNREICDAFLAHFRDRFASCPDLPLQEFRSYLADFTRLVVAEAAGCEGVVTECEVRDALKQVGLKKSPGLDGLPYKVCLRLPHILVPILMDMFNHWRARMVSCLACSDQLANACASSSCLYILHMYHRNRHRILCHDFLIPTSSWIRVHAYV